MENSASEIAKIENVESETSDGVEEITKNVFAELESQWDKESEQNMYSEVKKYTSNTVGQYSGKIVRGLVALNIISDIYKCASEDPHILVELDHFMIRFVEKLQAPFEN